jgi:hypothetical protein
MDFGKSAAAFRRARWLAELADAINAAEDAANQLILSGHQIGEARELQEQLKIVKRELEDVRLGGWRAPAQEIGSKWIKLGEG